MKNQLPIRIKEKTILVFGLGELRQLAYVLCQTRFIAGGGVLVNNTLIHHFVNCRNGRTQQFATRRFVMGGESRPQFLDLRTQAATVAAIDRVSLSILTSSLFSGFMISHYTKSPLDTGETMSLRRSPSDVNRPAIVHQSHLETKECMRSTRNTIIGG